MAFDGAPSKQRRGLKHWLSKRLKQAKEYIFTRRDTVTSLQDTGAARGAGGNSRLAQEVLYGSYAEVGVKEMTRLPAEPVFEDVLPPPELVAVQMTRDAQRTASQTGLPVQDWRRSALPTNETTARGNTASAAARAGAPPPPAHPPPGDLDTDTGRALVPLRIPVPQPRPAAAPPLPSTVLPPSLDPRKHKVSEGLPYSIDARLSRYSAGWAAQPPASIPEAVTEEEETPEEDVHEEVKPEDPNRFEDRPPPPSASELAEQIRKQEEAEAARLRSVSERTETESFWDRIEAIEKFHLAKLGVPREEGLYVPRSRPQSAVPSSRGDYGSSRPQSAITRPISAMPATRDGSTFTSKYGSGGVGAAPMPPRPVSALPATRTANGGSGTEASSGVGRIDMPQQPREAFAMLDTGAPSRSRPSSAVSRPYSARRQRSVTEAMQNIVGSYVSSVPSVVTEDDDRSERRSVYSDAKKDARDARELMTVLEERGVAFDTRKSEAPPPPPPAPQARAQSAQLPFSRDEPDHRATSANTSDVARPRIDRLAKLRGDVPGTATLSAHGAAAVQEELASMRVSNAKAPDRLADDPDDGGDDEDTEMLFSQSRPSSPVKELSQVSIDNGVRASHGDMVALGSPQRNEATASFDRANFEARAAEKKAFTEESLDHGSVPVDRATDDELTAMMFGRASTSERTSHRDTPAPPPPSTTATATVPAMREQAERFSQQKDNDALDDPRIPEISFAEEPSLSALPTHDALQKTENRLRELGLVSALRSSPSSDGTSKWGAVKTSVDSGALFGRSHILAAAAKKMHAPTASLLAGTGAEMPQSSSQPQKKRKGKKKLVAGVTSPKKDLVGNYAKPLAEKLATDRQNSARGDNPLRENVSAAPAAKAKRPKSAKGKASGTPYAATSLWGDGASSTASNATTANGGKVKVKRPKSAKRAGAAAAAAAAVVDVPLDTSLLLATGTASGDLSAWS
ncbi:hypothetical protein RI054_18g81550 [Pseudoscourfieldia marina]